MPNDKEHQKLDMTTFILSVSSAAFMGLREDRADFDLARQNIDLLDLIKEKTKGNLSVDEQKLLDGLLFETKMRFVEAQKRKKS